MKKLIRTILRVVVVLVVLAVVGVVGVAVFADWAVKAAVESAGTKALDVGVEVGRADASILGGSVGLQDIRVANPQGYQGPALLTLQRVDVAADAGSLLGSEVHIKELTLDGMEVFVEQKGLQNNLYEVIQPLHQPGEPSGKKLIIDHMELADITVHVSVTGLPGRPPSADFTLDKITMTDLGRNEKIDVAMLIGKILLAVAAGVAQQGGDILPRETIGEMTGILDKAVDIGKILLGSGKTPDGRQQDSPGKSLTDGLEDLLGVKNRQ